MKKLTAVQELIHELKQFKKFPMVDQATIQAAIEFAELKLEVEREQIENTYWDGGQDVPLFEETCKEYYNKTYGTE
jgi:hypothetical protein